MTTSQVTAIYYCVLFCRRLYTGRFLCVVVVVVVVSPLTSSSVGTAT